MSAQGDARCARGRGHCARALRRCCHCWVGDDLRRASAMPRCFLVSPTHLCLPRFVPRLCRVRVLCTHERSSGGRNWGWPGGESSFRVPQPLVGRRYHVTPRWVCGLEGGRRTSAVECKGSKDRPSGSSFKPLIGCIASPTVGSLDDASATRAAGARVVSCSCLRHSIERALGYAVEKTTGCMRANIREHDLRIRRSAVPSASQGLRCVSPSVTPMGGGSPEYTEG